MSPAGLAWLNGRFVPPAELVVGYADAGFASGVTLTDFCRTYRHRLFRWPDHLRRLRHDCDACHVPLPYTDEILTAAAEELAARHAASLPPGDDLAVITFATPGQLGHLTGTGESGPPTVGMHTITLAKERYRRFFTEGVTLAVAGTWSTGGELAVVPHRVKHRSRLHWWMAEKAIRDPANPFYCPGIGPGAIPVLWGEHGELADTPVGSVLVVVRGGHLILPVCGTVLDSVSVGVVRELCGRVGITVPDALPIDFRYLLQPDGPLSSGIDEIMLAGSGFGIAGVRRVVCGERGGRDYDWPGPVYRRLAAAWSAMVGVNIAGQFMG